MDIHPLVGKQAESVRLCNARVNIFEGAVRSSKTISSLIAWLGFIRHGPDGPLLMFGRTERTLIRNLLDPLVEMIGPQRCRIVSGSGIAYILGRKVYLVGANDDRSQEKIRGLSLAGGYGDELSTIPSSFWTMFLTRLSIPGAKAFGSSNPDGPEHWLKKDYLDRARLHLTGDGEILRYDDSERLDLHRFSFQLADNPSLDEDYVRSLHLEHRGLWRRRLVLGEWCMAEGVVYDMFDQDRHVIRGPLPPMIRVPGVGVDVGTVNPTAALMLGIQGPDSVAGTPARLVLMREYRFDSKKALAQKTDAELSRDLRAWIGSDRPEWVFVDPSAASFKLQLHRDGMGNAGWGYVHDAKNAVLDGTRLVSSLLATNQLVIHESCTGLLSELSSYSWDEKAAQRGEDKPLKINDHSCFVTGTPIRTMNGEIPIQEVTPGTLVATRSGWRPVVASGMTHSAARVYDVELSNGDTLTGTGNHPVWVEGHGWTNVDSLRYGDRMMSWSKAMSRSSMGSNSDVTRIRYETPTGAITRRASQIARKALSAFTKRSGWPSTGRSQKVTTSTTRTTTLSTTTRRTSNASTPTSTAGTTLRNAKPLAGSPRQTDWSTSNASGRWQVSGIAAMLAEPGTPNMDARPGWAAKPLTASASSAGRPIRLALPTAANDSVPTPARAPGGAMRDWMTWIVRASSAASLSGSIATPRDVSAPVRVQAVTRRSATEPVWNLTVAGQPEYFAAGVLVHNCDAARYVISSCQSEWRPFISSAMPQTV